jgi:VanZ family protein
MKIRKLWPAIAWALFILVLMGTPGNYFPTVTSFWDWLSVDKLVHVFVFGVFSFLILLSVSPQYFASNKRYVFVATAIGIALAYGLLTEVLQAHVFAGRNGNAYDFFADGIGAISGWLAFWLVYGKKIKTYSNKNQD